MPKEIPPTRTNPDAKLEAELCMALFVDLHLSAVLGSLFLSLATLWLGIETAQSETFLFVFLSLVPLLRALDARIEMDSGPCTRTGDLLLTKGGGQTWGDQHS